MVTKSKKTKKKPAKKVQPPEPPAEIQERQWTLPASYCADGEHFASLREVVDPNTPTLTFSELSSEQRADVVAKRIQEQPKFQIVMLGAGLLDQQRAIAEVKANTKIGRALVEIEQRVINHQLAKAIQAAVPEPPPAPPPPKKKPAKKKPK